MDKFPIHVISVLMALAGALILYGEWLCVEVAWRCLDYNEIKVGLGVALIGAAVLLQMAFFDVHLACRYILRKLHRTRN